MYLHVHVGEDERSGHMFSYTQRSEDKLGCHSSSSTLFEEESLVYHCIC